MKLALPRFQFRFMPAAGNVIFPANFHPVGTRRAADEMVDRALAAAEGSRRPGPAPESERGLWLIVGGSGGFGSAARIALATQLGADTISLSLDAQPNPDSGNKIRKIGSPGYHRNAQIESRLRDLGFNAVSRQVDAFDPEARARVLEQIAGQFPGRKLSGVIWALAAPRGLDPRTGKAVSSVLKPLGAATTVRSLAAPDGDDAPTIGALELPPGTPEEAVATIYVMGGAIVQLWMDALSGAELVGPGFQLFTMSYRGNAQNAAIYRDGLIGLAKADLEFHTKAIDAGLRERVGGRAVAVEGPAVVTEASGGIPGVPLYMAVLRSVLGDSFEDPLDNMLRMCREHLAPGRELALDSEGLLRMDDRELAEDVQTKVAAIYDGLLPGSDYSRPAFDDFMTAYAQTRGFDVPGVDYSAEFDVAELT